MRREAGARSAELEGVTVMKIATAAYPIDWHNRWNDFVGKLRVWVRNAAEHGAELLVFPEYGAMELASLAGEDNARDRAKSLEAVHARLKDVDDLHASLAREFRLHICAGSAPVKRDGRFANRARFFAPDGSHGHQDKLIPVPSERVDPDIAPGREVRVFDTALGTIGILICYDAEFPLIARAMVEAGAEILLVPSSTETLRGYWRVRVGAMARALEGQCVVAHSVTVGEAGWLTAVGTTTGAAGIYGPPDVGFPEDGLIALGKVDGAGWVHAEVSLETVRQVRAEGKVLNHRHWPEQDARLAAVERVTLGQQAPAEPT
jgi:predicted amidohydrolase